MKKYWFEILLITAVMAVHVYAATSDAWNFPSSWFTRDDAYYYFKVAQNITEGHGVTFDGINPTNGYHPLWMLVNIPIFALARFDLILPLRILLLIQGGFSAAVAVLIYRVAREAISPPVAIAAASWWAFDLYLHNVMYEYGLETGLASLAVALLIYQLFQFEKRWRNTAPTARQIAGLGLCALFALFSRLDLVFLAILAGVWIILRGTPMRNFLLLDILLAASSVFAGFILRLGVQEYYTYTKTVIFMIAVSVFSKIILYYMSGLYQPVLNNLFRRTALYVISAVSLSTILTSAIMLAASSLRGGFPRLVLVYDWILNLAGMLAIRGLWRLFSQEKKHEYPSPLEALKTRWQTWLKEGAVYYCTLAIPLGLYMLFNKLVIGTAMPVSGQIKRWWGEPGSRAYGGAARTPLAFWGTDLGADFNAWNPLTGWLERLSRIIAAWRGFYRNDETYAVLLLVVCAAWLFILLLQRRKAVRAASLMALPLLFTASFFQILSYNASGYSAMKEWYWITEPLFLVFALGLAVWQITRPLIQLPAGKAAVWLAAAAFSLLMAWNFGTVIMERMPHGAHNPGGPYMDSATFLEMHTLPGSLIGMTGGGNVGYYIKDRTIVNLDGLINSPRYFEALKEGQASGYLEAMGLDYIFANPTILDGTPYKGQFMTGAALDRFGGKVLMEFGQ